MADMDPVDPSNGAASPAKAGDKSLPPVQPASDQSIDQDEGSPPVARPSMVMASAFSGVSEVARQAALRQSAIADLARVFDTTRIVTADLSGAAAMASAFSGVSEVARQAALRQSAIADLARLFDTTQTADSAGLLDSTGQLVGERHDSRLWTPADGPPGLPTIWWSEIQARLEGASRHELATISVALAIPVAAWLYKAYVTSSAVREGVNLLSILILAWTLTDALVRKSAGR